MYKPETTPDRVRFHRATTAHDIPTTHHVGHAADRPVRADPCLRRAPRASANPEFHPSPDPALKALPFSEAVQAGGFLFVSGEIGSQRGKMALVPGGITPEARQAIENVREILQRHGASLSDVVQCTVFLADMKDWPAFNSVYREYFKPPFPARSATGATGLALGARVELQCTAYAPRAR